jgi:hypothetical protein
MKRRSRIPPRSKKRSVSNSAAQQRAISSKYISALSEDQVRGTPDAHIPLSLKTGAGRQHWDEVLGLLVKIRTECDIAAERLGYGSPEDDGLAAVEYIANEILEAVRGERQQQITRPKKEPTTKPVEKTEKPLHRASHSERTKWVDETQANVARRENKVGRSS